jgi:two-component system sensor kinase FixL
VIELVESDAIIRNVTIAEEFDANLPLLRGDRVELQQVVLNLLLNAMEAMTHCETGRIVVLRTERGTAATVEVSVHDSGMGLPAGAEHLVFEPFYTTKPAGMGMGLSVARSIVEAHGGRIWASNTPGRGATFHFSLPATDGGGS